MNDRDWEELEIAARADPETGIRFEELMQEHWENNQPPSLYIDWPKFWAKDRDDIQWLYEPVLAWGRGHAIFAGFKVGKSLFTLAMVAELATSDQPVIVIYLDYEMTEDDLEERLQDMGHGPQTDLSKLRYALLPSIPPLDTALGADALLHLVDVEQAAHPDHHVVVVIDTTSRAVHGEENKADTIQDFYRHTGMGLKRRKVTWVRLDHAGKDGTKGQRGSSAKGDDVDVVWRVTQVDGGLKFHREATRMSWVTETVDFKRHNEPLKFVWTQDTLWPEGTVRIAQILDELDAPVEISVRAAKTLLTEHGKTAGRDLLTKAVKYRKEGYGKTLTELTHTVPPERDGTPGTEAAHRTVPPFPKGGGVPVWEQRNGTETEHWEKQRWERERDQLHEEDE